MGNSGRLTVRTALILLSPVACQLITACGFHPVYGVNKYTHTGVEEKLQRTTISNIPDREGQFLRNELITRFYRNGRPVDPLYTLTVEPITEGLVDLDITKDADSTRGQLRLDTTMRLKDSKTAQILIERPLSAIVSYNILQSEFTNRVSEQNARENALGELARQIEQHVALYLKRSQ